MQLNPLLQHTSACGTLQVGPLPSNASNSATLATLDLRVQLSFTSAESDTGLNPAPMTKKMATSKHPASRMRSTSGLARCPITVCLHHQLLGLALILIGLSISWPALDVPTYSLHQSFISNLRDAPSFSPQYMPQHRDLDDPGPYRPNVPLRPDIFWRQWVACITGCRLPKCPATACLQHGVSSQTCTFPFQSL